MNYVKKTTVGCMFVLFDRDGVRRRPRRINRLRVGLEGRKGGKVSSTKGDWRNVDASCWILIWCYKSVHTFEFTLVLDNSEPEVGKFMPKHFAHFINAWKIPCVVWRRKKIISLLETFQVPISYLFSVCLGCTENCLKTESFAQPLSWRTVHFPRLFLYCFRRWSCPCKRPWRFIGFWDIEALTFSRLAMTNWRAAGRIRPAAWFTPAPAKSQVYFLKILTSQL
jgi:hypothetical protein